VLIIHGEDTKSSYNRLNLLLDTKKGQGGTVASHQGSELSLALLKQQLSPQNIFGDRPLIVIHSLLSGLKSKQKDLLKKALLENQSHEIILYEQKEIPPGTLKQFSSSKIENFKISSTLFKFLDSLSPESPNLHRSLSLLIKEGSEPEFIFAMLTRQIRLLIKAKTSPNTIKLPPFIKKNLSNQAGKFSLSHLLKLHHLLYKIDKQIKLGQTTLETELLLTGFISAINTPS